MFFHEIQPWQMMFQSNDIKYIQILTELLNFL